MVTEIWKPITINGGIYKDWYDVSNFGRVRSLHDGWWGRSVKPKILNEKNPNPNNYPLVQLCLKGKNLRVFIHRLVAHEFLPKSDKKEVNHIDFNKNNNNIHNLEWVTPSENMIHSYKIGTHGKNLSKYRSNNKLTKEQIIQIRKNYPKFSQKQLALKYKVNPCQISKIIANKQWVI